MPGVGCDADRVQPAGKRFAHWQVHAGEPTGRHARGRLFRADYLARIQPLIGLLREIGAGHAGKNPNQVALNWAICKGALPIPGAKNARQAQENAGALGWRLTADEVAALDAASDRVTAK